LCLTKYNTTKDEAPRPEGVWKSRSKAPRIINLDTRWRWVASFTLRPLYSTYCI